MTQIASIPRDGINRLIASRDWRHMSPVWAAVRDCGLVFVHLFPGQIAPKLPAKERWRPLLALIADDPPGGSQGPEVFHQASLRRLLRPCHGVLVHAAAAEDWHYTGAVAAALARGRCAVIETSAAHEAAWLHAAGRLAPGAEPTVITRQIARYSVQAGSA